MAKLRSGGKVGASSGLVSLEHRGRVEPELPRGSYSGLSPETPTAGLWSADLQAHAEPRHLDFAPRKALPPSAASDRVRIEGPRLNSAFLLLVGLVIAAIGTVYFGISFFLLSQPEEKFIAATGPASSGGEEARITPKVMTGPSDPQPRTIATAETPPAPNAPSYDPAPPAPPPQASGPPAAAGFARPRGESTRNASGGNRSYAHPATRRGGAAHHQVQPSPQVENQPSLSAAMDRAHRENFSDSPGSLTPPRAGARSAFDQLISHLTGQAKPAPSLTPPRADPPYN